MPEQTLRLVTVIVQRKHVQKVVNACTSAGAPGATFFYGQGTGVRERLGFLGAFIDAEKAVIQVVADADTAKRVLDAAVQAADLRSLGNGFAYVQDVIEAVGFVPSEARGG